MTTVDKVARLTSQLVGDISRLPGVQLDTAGEAQLVQLLTDAMEAVGHIALDNQAGDYQPCRCGECETCPTCIEDHRRFRQHLDDASEAVAQWPPEERTFLNG